MKSIFLTKNEIKTGSALTLPVIIRLVQQSIGNVNSKNSDNVYENRGIQAGYIGNSYFDFTFDFTCAPIETCDENNDEFKEINSILQNQLFPTFTRKYFIDNYIVLEIPDYGHQSMSPGFRDFVPHIFINGKKLWQKYIGVIRQYSMRKAFLVISKENNLGWDGTINDIIIRIVFKNNIELAEANGHKCESVEFTDSEGYYNFKFNISNFVFLDSDNLDDYEIYISNNNTKLIKFENGLKFKFDNLPVSVETQNKVEKISKEYFRQAYLRDYSTSSESKPEYERNLSEIYLTISFDKTFYNLDNIGSLYLISKQNNYNAVYEKISDNSEKNISTDILVFNKDGILCNSLENNNSYEFIYPYSSRVLHKIKFESTDVEDNINFRDIIKTLGIYSKNNLLSSFKYEYMIFNNGELKSSDINSIVSLSDISENDYLYFYFDNVFDNSIENTTPKNIPGISIESDFKISLSDSNKLTLTNNTIPFNTNILYKGSDKNIELTAIMKYFPIYFNKTVIDSDTILFEFPVWMFDNKLNPYYSLEENVYVDNYTKGNFYKFSNRIGTAEGSLLYNWYEKSAALNIINKPTKIDIDNRIIKTTETTES